MEPAKNNNDNRNALTQNLNEFHREFSARTSKNVQIAIRWELSLNRQTSNTTTTRINGVKSKNTLLIYKIAKN